MTSKKSIRVYFQGLILILLFILTTGGFSSISAKNRLSRIPDVLVSFGPEQGSEHAVVVETSTQTLYLFSYDGSFKEIKNYRCSTGEVPGAKSRSGDRKTPVGVYFFTKEFKKRDLTPIYGTRAFPMDYPNVLDRQAGYSGNAIWLHGTNKPIKPRDSNGCIALANPHIDALDSYITLNRTPIIVVDTLSYTSVKKLNSTKASVLRFLSSWNNALQTGTYHQFLSYYHPDYLPEIGWWPEWGRIKKAMGTSYALAQIDLDKIAIYRYSGVYVALFDQTLKSETGSKLIGTRKLFFKKDGKRFRIIGDEYQSHPFPKEKKKRKQPFLVAFHKNKIKPKPKIKPKIEPKKESDEIAKTIEGWLKAWSSKDIRRYGAYYAKGFRSQGKNRKSWLQYKKQLNKKYKYIRVSKKNLTIQNGKKKSIATFIQTYKSPKFKAVGRKRLMLIKESGRWKILRETYRKL